MMRKNRRSWLLGALGILGAGGLAALSGWRAAHASDAPRTIAVTARRFAYTPSDIVVTAGEPVVLEVMSMDFAHGMNFPDFGMRFDLVPGRIVRIELPAKAAGIYEFHCDNFCGEDHEAMHGRLVVKN